MGKLVRFGKMSSLVLKLIPVLGSIIGVAALQSQQPLQLAIHWDKVTAISKTTPTLQMVVNPPLRPGQPLGKAAYTAVKDLGVDYVRYVPGCRIQSWLSPNSSRRPTKRPLGNSLSSIP